MLAYPQLVDIGVDIDVDIDVEKLNSISREYISRMKAVEVYDKLLIWAKEFDNDFADLITKYKDYTISILNIEREQKKPRKDFSCYSEIKSYIWYMYDELFIKNKLNYDWQNINDKDEIKQILTDYIDNYYVSERYEIKHVEHTLL